MYSCYSNIHESLGPYLRTTAIAAHMTRFGKHKMVVTGKCNRPKKLAKLSIWYHSKHAACRPMGWTYVWSRRVNQGTVSCLLCMVCVSSVIRRGQTIRYCVEVSHGLCRQASTTCMYVPRCYINTMVQYCVLKSTMNVCTYVLRKHDGTILRARIYYMNVCTSVLRKHDSTMRIKSTTWMYVYWGAT